MDYDKVYIFIFLILIKYGREEYIIYKKNDRVFQI